MDIRYSKDQETKTTDGITLYQFEADLNSGEIEELKGWFSDNDIKDYVLWTPFSSRYVIIFIAGPKAASLFRLTWG